MLEDRGHLRKMLWGIHNIAQHTDAMNRMLAPLGEHAMQKMQYDYNRGTLDLVEIAKMKFCCNRAIAFELVVIGEAASKVSPATQERHSTIPWKLVTGTRNHLAHKPWDVKQEIVDDIVANNLPALKQQISSILAY